MKLVTEPVPCLQAAASCYIDLIVKESDNNVKLIVLDRLIALKEHPTQERVLQDLVMDILRVLASPDLEVRKKTLNLGECKNRGGGWIFMISSKQETRYKGKIRELCVIFVPEPGIFGFYTVCFLQQGFRKHQHFDKFLQIIMEVVVTSRALKRV